MRWSWKPQLDLRLARARCVPVGWIPQSRQLGPRDESSLLTAAGRSLPEQRPLEATLAVLVLHPLRSQAEQELQVQHPRSAPSSQLRHHSGCRRRAPDVRERSLTQLDAV